jgi:hypothetical protein
MNIWKKALLSFFAIFLAFSTLLPSISYAQNSPWYAPTLEDFNKKVSGAPANEIFGERYTQAQVYWIIFSLVNIAIGQGVLDCTQVSQDLTQIGTCIEGVLGGTAIIPGVTQDAGVVLPLAMLVDQTIQNRPASGVQYVSEKLERLNLVDTAYAQNTGFGFTTLEPVAKLWVPVRNASYALMVVAIVVLAFMIMFRTRISPQASLTVQIAIPKIVIALVLITFSYAIAGFMIDLAYLVLGLVGAMFSVGGISTLDAPALFGGLQNWGNGMVAIGVMLFLYVLAPTLLLGIGSLGLLGIAAILILILVVIVYLIALVKILWVMFRSMLILTLLVVLAPIYILWGVISSSGGFGGWLKMFVANLSIFVTIPLLIFFANVIMWGSVGGPSVLAPSLFLNPYGIDTTLIAGGMQLPGFFGGYNAIFGMVGGIVLLLSAPKLAAGIRDYIATGKGQFGLAGGKEALGPLYGAYSLGAGAVGGAISTATREVLVPEQGGPIRGIGNAVTGAISRTASVGRLRPRRNP